MSLLYSNFNKSSKNILNFIQLHIITKLKAIDGNIAKSCKDDPKRNENALESCTKELYGFENIRASVRKARDIASDSSRSSLCVRGISGAANLKTHTNLSHFL